MSKTYEVIYFEGNGRAGNCRAMLDYSKTEYKNTLLNFGEWPALKASGKFENGQLPVLEVNGKQYTQSLAMETYLAKEFNLMGSNAEDEYQIMNLLCSREDYVKPIFEVIIVLDGWSLEAQYKLQFSFGELTPNIFLHRTQVSNKQI